MAVLDGVNESWYAKPDAGKWIISPSDEDPVAPHDAWADDMVLAEGLARYEEMVTEPVTRLETSGRAYAHLRPTAPWSLAATRRTPRSFGSRAKVAMAFKPPLPPAD